MFRDGRGMLLLLAGLTGCRPRQHDKILPYAARPPELTPGIAEHYATSMVLDGHATGVLPSVSGRDGRESQVRMPGHVSFSAICPFRGIG